MKSFLHEVAEDLYAKYGDRVGELKVLLPSRRARLFFSEALATTAQRPIWEPSWVEIDSLMGEIAGIKVGEHIRLIAELYRVYVEHHPTETFDRFYFWGEILLADFDMVDKYMINADMLFRNISDIKELETDLSYLSKEQISIIVSFWSSIADGSEGEDLSEYKRRFLKVWQSLRAIYHQYRKNLKQIGIAYPGMVHRIAAERLKSEGGDIIDNKHHYVVAGFNALSKCENILFETLKNSSTTHFYWDWDSYYAQNEEQEAGLFIKKNIKDFTPSTDISHNNFEQPKEVEVVASSSSSLQCKYVAEILDGIVKDGGVIDKRTAIVLTDESLLLPLLYALPKYVGRVNVTMGYPLRHSLAYSFIERLLQLQNRARQSATDAEVNFYHTDVVGLLAHPYLDGVFDKRVVAKLERQICEERLIRVPQPLLQFDNISREIFVKCDDWSDLSSYIRRVIDHVIAAPQMDDDEGDDAAQDDAAQKVEFLSFLSDQIVKLHNSIEQCSIGLLTSTYISLLRRHLQPLRIPFEGEPLEGLQVMGILETRNLDFDNVIILSMNDDNFPGNSVTQPSYIPYNLRAAYELPTPEHHDGVYAYYFYRLVQRSQRLWMLYCSCADEMSTGEQSRYITQLDFESPFELRRIDVGVDVNIFDSETIEVAKQGVVAEQLRRYICEGVQRSHNGEESWGLKKLSPTAICQYVACPMRFYFSSLAGIRTRDEELLEQVDAPMFGTILHDAMQELYKPLIGVSNLSDGLALIKPKDIDKAVIESIDKNYFRKKGKSITKESLSGDLMLVHEIVSNYISNGVVRFDRSNPNFEVMGVEMEVEHLVTLSNGQPLRLWGISDRIDLMKDGSLRVVDYKTGESHLEFKGVKSLFFGEERGSQANILQTLLYSYMLRESRNKGEMVLPSLYYVRKMNGDEYSPLLIDTEGQRTTIDSSNFGEYYDSTLPLISQKLDEMFDFDTPFRQCDDPETTCRYCDYKELCRR